MTLAAADLPIATTEADVMLKNVSREMHNVKKYGAVGDNSANDLNAFQNAIGDAKLSGGQVIVPRPSVGYKLDGQLLFDNVREVEVVGCGGVPPDYAATCLLNFVGDYDYFVKIFGTNTSQLTSGIKFKGLDLRYSNSAFDGDIVKTFNGTCFNIFESCSFGGIGDGGSVMPNARGGLNLNDSVTTKIVSCFFGGTQYGIIGLLPGTTYATDVGIYNTRFIKCGKYGILNPHQVWNIRGNAFEFGLGSVGGGTGGMAGGIACGREGGSNCDYGLFVSHNGFWDAANGGIWIDWAGNGLSVTDNFIEVGGSATFLDMSRGAYGVNLRGNTVNGTSGGKFVNITNSIVEEFNDDGSNTLIGGVQRLVTSSPNFVKRTSRTVASITSNINVAGGDAAGAILAVTDNGYGSGANANVLTGGKTTRGVVRFHQDSASTANKRLVLVYFGGDAANMTPKTVTLTPLNGAAAALGSSQAYVDRSLGDMVVGGFNIRGGATVPAGDYEWAYEVGF